MEANELRVGNWVISNGVKMQLTQFALGVHLTNQNMLDKTEPIPITDEILDKISTSIKVSDEPNEWYHGMKSWYFNEWNDFNYSNAQVYYGDSNIRAVEYLHDLQNLYYCIHDDELKVNI